MGNEYPSELNLSIGALSDPLDVQLKTFKLDKKEIEHWQKDIDALNRLRIRGIIAKSAIINGEKKLFRQITKAIKKKIANG